MDNIIEDFYLGNLNPSERCYRTGSEEWKLLKKISDLEEEITGDLEGDARNRYLEFVELYGELNSRSTMAAFVSGFRLAARLMLDTFLEADPDSDQE